ncbi:MAG TPA: hypothetical protein VIE90_09440 [Candidatus Binatia bacterium]
MSSITDELKTKLSEVIGWERRKRRERICVTVGCAALASALVLFPLNVLLPMGWLRWLVPVALFGMLAPFFFHRRRWQRQDDARAALSLDKTLRLDERAVTAWELSRKADPTVAAQLVFQQAYEKLSAIEPRALFPRAWSWPAYLILPLLVLWFTFLWFDFDRWDHSAERSPPPRSLAQKAREYSRELQEKARDQGFRESLKMGQELEKVARAGVENQTLDESFKKELAGMAKKFEEAANSTAEKNTFSAAESQQSLKDLRAELAAARDLAQLPDLPKGAEEFGRQWMDQLATLPQLKRHLDKADQSGRVTAPSDLKSFLDKLDRQATNELDRRALLDAQQYLQQMMKQGPGQKGEHLARSGGPGEEDPNADGAEEKNHNSMPGKEPGKRDAEYRSLPEFRAGPTTQVKGALGEGESSSVVFKGKPTPGKSTVAQADVVASYRRQAEQELNSERVPEALKETIKNYFLSLGQENR